MCRLKEPFVVVSDRLAASAVSEANWSKDFCAQFDMHTALVWDRLGVVLRHGQLGPGQGDLCREHGFVPDFDGQVVASSASTESLTCTPAATLEARQCHSITSTT